MAPLDWNPIAVCCTCIRAERTHFRAADGLSERRSHGGIFEDREGNIWVGTWVGSTAFATYAISTIGTK